MSFLDTISGISSFIDSIRSGVQAGKADYEQSGDFWQSVGTGMSELVTGEYQEQKELQSTINAEQRALENARALRDEENAYNSPSAQAERYKQAGINPMSVLTSSAPIGASGTTIQSSGGQRSKTAIPSMSSLLDYAMAEADIDLKEAQADNLRAGTGKLTVDTALAEWDVKLKEQLYNYNSENYPILLDAGRQKLTNLGQEYKNLVAKENYDKANADKLRKDIEKAQEEIWLLQLQYYQEEQQIEINSAKLKQMAQDFEKGEFEKHYMQWHAQHEKALSQIAVTRGKITDKEWTDLWESGLMKEKTEQERDQIKEMVTKLTNDNALWSDIWVTGKDENLDGQLFRRLFYLATELI